MQNSFFSSLEAFEARVLYSDNHLLAVDKPAGLLTQDSGTGRENLEDMAREWVKAEKGKPGNVFLHCVHRIDRPVSGVVLFARTGKALSRLNAELRAGRFRKVYQAVVEGCPPQPAGRLEHWLKHGDRCAVISEKSDPDAKRSLLDYKVIKNGAEFSLLEIGLITGRYHQIRAQLSAISCPIVGDKRYGSSENYGSNAIMLHSCTVEFIHPTKKEQISVNCGCDSSWDSFLKT